MIGKIYENLFFCRLLGKIFVWHSVRRKQTIFFLGQITTQKNSENEALKLYNNLIIPNIVMLEKPTSRYKNRKENILNVVKNLESVFTGVYLHYDNVPKLE